MKNTLLLIVFALLITNASAQSFSRNQVYDSLKLTSEALNTPNRVTLFDYDEDGDEDIFYYSGLNDTRILVYHNDNGSFDSSFVFFNNSNGNSQIEDMTLIDYDADGDFDIIAFLASYPNGDILKFENLGNGNFNLSTQTNLISKVSDYIASADLDNDSLPDLVYTTGNPNQIRWVKNLGAGNFATTYDTIANNNGYFELADMNNDGYIDLIVESGTDDIYLNDGNG
ncbi:MAG: VCBS repeat-containing protein, partial [Candidatus Paceibacterota bacterium]